MAQVAFYSTKSKAELTHVDEAGKAGMVDVSHKNQTLRTATAVGKIRLGSEAFQAVVENRLNKGDVLTVAQIAGINAAKQTGMLIPLCHPLLLSSIKVDLQLDHATNSIGISATVKCTGNTGVEMEAITAVSIAACTVYDMCKAIDKSIEITSIRLKSKSGGASGDYFRRDD